MRPIFSHSGKRLAITWRTPFPFINSWHLFDFDPATGALSNQLDFPLQGFNFAQACEFSPNDQVLYMADFDGLHQYDLTHTTASAIQNSQYTLNPNISPLHIRLAPDGKIYDEALFSANMASIAAPNNLGAACAYTTMSVDLSPGRGQIGLPLGVRGTPSFLINGKLLVGAQPLIASTPAKPSADINFLDAFTVIFSMARPCKPCAGDLYFSGFQSASIPKMRR